jgi:hypothetical protein
MTIAYVSISQGHFVAERVPAENGRKFTLLKNAAGEAIGSVAGRPKVGEIGTNAQLDGMDLAARDNIWYLPSPRVASQPGDANARGRPILDSSGHVFARVERPSAQVRLIHLPAATLTWQRHTLRPTYRIDDAYSASRTMLHQWFSGVTNRPFAGEIGPRLAGAPDGVLALLLAAFFTNNAIGEQNRRQQITWANPQL